MNEALDLIKSMLVDLQAWSKAFPDCEETKELIRKAEAFLKEVANA